MNAISSTSSDEEWDVEIDLFKNDYYGIPRRYRVYGELWKNYGLGEYFNTVRVKLGRFPDKFCKYFQMATDIFYYFINILYTIFVYFGFVCIEFDQKQMVIIHR